MYWEQREHLKLDAEMKAAGILGIVVKMGSDLGISNVLCKWGNLLDVAEEIHIRYGSTTKGVVFSFQFTDRH